ncbi:hypothetical protein [Flavobacterium beibuense]|uniref:Uncharacterized protein n=1 Tax=Flavobacterium beibuense TaxID=657326 RepID=A0A444W6Y4_9FLAO|nr:hypothetical protein [Flavobacterium beibuense]RYJ41614.1 hypothetical protein NU09_2988 [Flavobacterium beibuense]
MKKKLEAELISIAHRILKLKNKAEIEQLQQETLKLYEKLSVLKFVEENFHDVKPTIGYASAEEKLEDIYGVKEEADKPEAVKEAPADAGEPKEELGETEKEAVAESIEEIAEVKEEVQEEAKEETPEPEHQIELEKTEEELEAMEESVEAVYEKEQDSTEEEEEQAADAEMITLEPEEDVEVEKSDVGFEFAFERKAAPEEPKEEPKKEIGIDDFHDYVEPEFVKKSDFEAPKQEEPKEEPVAETPSEPVFEPVKEEPKAEEPKKEDSWAPASSRSLNDTFAKTITLGLNDRIAFEKHLFGGSADDLNRVVSQLNTINTYDEAKTFINDLIKPDYNNWEGKEEYEERFFQLVEKRFD